MGASGRNLNPKSLESLLLQLVMKLHLLATELLLAVNGFFTEV